MNEFNENTKALAQKYDGKADVIDLLLWINIRVQTLADMRKGDKDHE